MFQPSISGDVFVLGSVHEKYLLNCVVFCLSIIEVNHSKKDVQCVMFPLFILNILKQLVWCGFSGFIVVQPHVLHGVV